MHLPTDPKSRKATPLYSGLVKYFPDALVAVAQVSQKGNDQHNPGQPLHWSREKSADHEDTLLRHLFDCEEIDVDGIPHIVKVAWRALAAAQLFLEREQANKSAANEARKIYVKELKDSLYGTSQGQSGVLHHYPGACINVATTPSRAESD